MAEFFTFLFFLQNGFFALIGIGATYRFLWRLANRRREEASRLTEESAARRSELEAELQALREMAKSLEAARRGPGVSSEASGFSAHREPAERPFASRSVNGGERGARGGRG